MPFPKIELEVDGMKTEGWESLAVSMGMDRAVRAFQLSVATRRQEIRPGQACRMLLDDEPLVTGYIDSVRSSYAKGSHTTAIAGRSKTADLVDCSIPRGMWKSLSTKRHDHPTLAELANRWVEPFGLDVRISQEVHDRLKRIENYSPEPGRRVFEAIEFLARQAGVLCMDDADGNLVMADAGQAGRVATALVASETGWTVLSATVDSTFAQRYSEYTLLSKTGVSWTGDNSEEVRQHTTTALDQSVTRFRPSAEFAEQSLNLKQAQERVLWRANVERRKIVSGQRDRERVEKSRRRYLEIEHDSSVSGCRAWCESRTGHCVCRFVRVRWWGDYEVSDVSVIGLPLAAKQKKSRDVTG